MAEKKISRKELLKEPDEFLTYTGMTLKYIREHPRQATAAGIVVVLVILCGLGFYYYQHARERKSHELLQQAIKAYEAVSHAKQPLSDQLDQLLASFDYIAATYPSLLAGEEAVLYSGHVLFLKKDYPRALEKYQQLQSSSMARKGLASLIMYHIGRTFLAMKEYDKAVLVFDQLAKDADSPYRREAYGTIARIYEMMNKKKEAVQSYRQYLKIFPEAPDAAFVKSRIAELSPPNPGESS